jgi:predicted ATPase
MSRHGGNGDAQFIIATHSPILMTYPGADIISFDGGRLERVRLEDTPHYQITKGILENPGRSWKHLGEPPASPAPESS